MYVHQTQRPAVQRSPHKGLSTRSPHKGLRTKVSAPNAKVSAPTTMTLHGPAANYKVSAPRSPHKGLRTNKVSAPIRSPHLTGSPSERLAPSSGHTKMPPRHELLPTLRRRTELLPFDEETFVLELHLDLVAIVQRDGEAESASTRALEKSYHKEFKLF